MFGESIHAAPCRNQETVKEFLAAPCTLEPNLPDEKDDCKDDAVTDKGATHDEMCKALAEVVFPTEPQSSNASEEHLYPARYRHGFSKDPVRVYGIPTQASMNPLFQMQLQIDAEDNLDR